MNVEDIKYKALNIKTKTISNVINIICDWDGNIGEIETNEEDGITYSLDNNIVLLPFTGFKDKDGTEIYEGDILKVDTLDELYEVRFSFGCFKGFQLGGGKMGTLEAILDHVINEDTIDEPFEIIGNVWENPELLKE